MEQGQAEPQQGALNTDRRWIRQLPNILTLARLVSIPIFVVLMHDPARWMVWVAGFVFGFAALTDLADGYVARRYGAVSDIGKLLDPLADKILVMTALVMLVAQRGDFDGKPWVPGWIVVLILAREIWVTGLRGVAAAAGRVMPAASSGKVKSGLQMGGIVGLLMHDFLFRFGSFQIEAQVIGLNMLILSIAFSYWSAIDYTVRVVAPSENAPG